MENANEKQITVPQGEVKNNEHKPFNQRYNQQRNRHQRQARSVVDIINCSCGNTIKMFNRLKQVKCFKCNHYQDKNADGKWERQPFTITKDTLTLGDLGIKIRNPESVAKYCR